MRILKKKIALANAHLTSQALNSSSVSHSWASDEPISEESTLHTRAKRTCTNKPKQVLDINLTPEKTRETKNIVKNFGKAICNFAVSKIALPYLENIIQEEGVKLESFIAYVNQSKGDICGLYKFRALLIPQKEDSEEIAAFKRVFKRIGEVFIKYFSVNWIFHGRVQYKEAHLKFRYKMLRRIQKPELFTYLS